MSTFSNLSKFVLIGAVSVGSIQTAFADQSQIDQVSQQIDEHLKSITNLSDMQNLQYWYATSQSLVGWLLYRQYNRLGKEALVKNADKLKAQVDAISNGELSEIKSQIAIEESKLNRVSLSKVYFKILTDSSSEPDSTIRVEHANWYLLKKNTNKLVDFSNLNKELVDQANSLELAEKTLITSAEGETLLTKTRMLESANVIKARRERVMANSQNLVKEIELLRSEIDELNAVGTGKIPDYLNKGEKLANDIALSKSISEKLGPLRVELARVEARKAEVELKARMAEKMASSRGIKGLRFIAGGASVLFFVNAANNLLFMNLNNQDPGFSSLTDAALETIENLEAQARSSGQSKR